MKYMKIYNVFFSGRGTTWKVAEHFVSFWDQAQIVPVNLVKTMAREEPFELNMGPDDLAVFSVPVYAGRVPAVAADYIRKVKGEKTPAVLMCVYGNREFDDALIELNDLVVDNDFIPIAAGAFVAEHSIFPVVAKDRPDRSDLEQIRQFSEKAAAILENDGWKTAEPLQPRGSRPYREPGNVPLKPTSDSRCDRCGRCAAACPVQAIDPREPAATDEKKCISCGHCIEVCPRGARNYFGMKYKMAEMAFKKKCAQRKEPYTLFIDGLCVTR